MHPLECRILPALTACVFSSLKLPKPLTYLDDFGGGFAHCMAMTTFSTVTNSRKIAVLRVRTFGWGLLACTRVNSIRIIQIRLDYFYIADGIRTACEVRKVDLRWINPGTTWCRFIGIWRTALLGILEVANPDAAINRRNTSQSDVLRPSVCSPPTAANFGSERC